MLFRLREETELVNRVNNVPQIIPTLNPVLNLRKNLPDLVLDGVWPAGLGLEALEIGEKLAVDEIEEVVAGEGVVVIELAGFVLGRGPAFLR